MQTNGAEMAAPQTDAEASKNGNDLFIFSPHICTTALRLTGRYSGAGRADS